MSEENAPIDPKPEAKSPDRSPLTGLGDGAPTDPRSEKPLWQGRTDWKHFMMVVLMGTAVLIVLETILVFVARGTRLTTGWAIFVGALFAMLVAGSVSAIIFYRVLCTKYELTTQRLFIIRGILSQVRDENELIRVDDVRLHQTLPDRLFRLGTVEVISTDATDKDAKLVGIADAKAVAEHIRAQMRTLRSRSLFVENL